MKGRGDCTKNGKENSEIAGNKIKIWKGINKGR